MLRATPIFILILVYLLQNFLGAPSVGVNPVADGISLATAQESAARLAATTIPGRDVYDLTVRMKRHQGDPIPHTVRTTPIVRQVGDEDTFNIANEGESYYKLPATVRFVTDHAYWYVANDYEVDMAALESSTQVFEEQIYPTNRKYFGSEWSPGIDADPRITILLAKIKGVGGYYSSADEYPTAVNPFSNEREMIYIATPPSDFQAPFNYFEGTLAHEFQHMIHWNVHRNRDIWLDEGCAEMAMHLNGYDVGDSDRSFITDPNVQLTSWDGTAEKSRPHYGASYLFVGYLMEHYGQEKLLQALLSSPGTGVDAVNGALQRMGSSARLEDVFKDWVLANYINDPAVADGRYSYEVRGDAKIGVERRLVKYPDTHSSAVHQYAAQYVALMQGQGDTVVDFQGAQMTRMVNTQPHSGQHFWYSNRRDNADMTLTRDFDLSGQTKATLSYWTWYDIESDFDYGYVEVSADGGQTWDLLKPQHGSETNPNGANYGRGYTGRSGRSAKSEASPQWIHDQLDLSAYAGKQIKVRFEYVTDEAYNTSGWAIDDISIPELGYDTDAETDDAGWQGAGFVRLANAIPQQWYVAAIEYGPAGPTVQAVTLDANQQGTLEIPGLGSTTSRAIIVVAALAPTTTEAGTYTLKVRRKQ
jgi:hypothetical protein